jgi:hypothetical protein
MVCGLSWPIKAKKSYPETEESGTFWISTILDIDSRLRVARGIGKNETEASKKSLSDAATARAPRVPTSFDLGWLGRH